MPSPSTAPPGNRRIWSGYGPPTGPTRLGGMAESALDDAILAARAARPEGATWAALGEVLGVTGQAVSKRAGVRSLSRQAPTTQPSGAH